MQFQVFGVVEGRLGGVPFDLGRRRVERRLFGLLLLELGTPLSIDRLTGLLWGQDVPTRPRQAIQVSISRLRANLAAVDADRHGFRLLTRGAGYVLDGDPLRVDVHRFRTLCEQARAETDLDRRRTVITEALALAQGPVLGDVATGPIRDRIWPGHIEQVLAATELRIDADLELGDHARIIAELADLTREHPLRERIACQSVLALFRSGRLAEALTAARAFRFALADEHGLDPGQEFVALERAVLREDPGLHIGTGPTRPAPALLPPRIADFTARDTELAGLTAALAGPHSALPVCVISGPGGVGKSTLAVHAAHSVVESYPDGQLYADLRGATDTPATPSEVLGRFLRAIGDDVPEGFAERQDAYRSAVSGKRMLVVLDDAAGDHQLRALLPGTDTCAVLVTSRDRLPGVAGAHRTELGGFEPAVAIDLLTAIVGADRITAQPDAARRLADLCGGLPLAVRTAGARLGAHPHWAVQTMVDRLADERGRLDELTSGDLAVRASLGLSYRALDPVARRAFRLLGLLGVPDFAPWLVGALLDVGESVAEDVVDRLVDARLVDVAGAWQDGESRFRLHDLYRIYADERAEAEELPADRSAAVGRALGGWLWTIRQLAADTPSGEIDPCAAYTTMRQVRHRPADAEAWLSAELPGLVVAVERAAAMNLDVAAGEVSAALCSSSLGVGNRFDEWWRTHNAAIEAARRVGNRAGEAMLLAGLGQLRYAQDDFDGAHGFFGTAMDLFSAAGDVRGQAVALAGVGSAYREQGRLTAAREALTMACAEFRGLADDAGLGYSTRLAASVDLELGDHPSALSTVDEAVAAYRRLGSRRGEALSLRTRGLVHRAMDDHVPAEALFIEALEILTALGDRLMTAYAVQSLVKTRIRLGTASMPPLLDALDTCRSHQDRLGEGLVLRTMGELELAAGRLPEAEALLWQAIDVWDAVDLPLFRARALRDLASVQAAAGCPDAAATVRAEALAIFARFGTREHAELTTSMAGDLERSGGGAGVSG